MEYIVVEGDTLEDIAGRYNISVEKIRRLNNLRANEDLRAGMVLLLNQVSAEQDYAQAENGAEKRCNSCANNMSATTNQERATVPDADFDSAFNQPTEGTEIIYWPDSGWNNQRPNYPHPRPPYYGNIYGQVQFIEPQLQGVNYAWEESGDFRYILSTNKYRYREGERVEITFRKRNMSDKTVVLRYPSGQLFDFYVSDQDGRELWRWSDTRNTSGLMREIVLSPKQAETINIVWDQKTSNGYWIAAQSLTLWGVNTATNVSIPLEIVIY